MDHRLQIKELYTESSHQEQKVFYGLNRTRKNVVKYIVLIFGGLNFFGTCLLPYLPKRERYFSINRIKRIRYETLLSVTQKFCLVGKSLRAQNFHPKVNPDG